MSLLVCGNSSSILLAASNPATGSNEDHNGIFRAIRVVEKEAIHTKHPQITDAMDNKTPKLFEILSSILHSSQGQSSPELDLPETIASKVGNR